MFGPPSRSGLRLRYVTSRILQWSFLVLQSHCLRFFATMTPTEPRPSGSETPHQPSLTVGAPFALCAASHSAIAMQTICRRDDTTEPRPSGSDHDVPPPSRSGLRVMRSGLHVVRKSLRSAHQKSWHPFGCQLWFLPSCRSIND